MQRAALLLCVLVLAGCGGDEEQASEAPPAATSAEAQPQEATSVAIKDFTFDPGEITVSAGDEVTWVNADASNHNVVFDDDAQSGIPNVRKGEEGTVNFKKTGTFTYVCSYHPGMKGAVVVS